MINVIKKNGKKERFNAKKLAKSIDKAAKEAKVSSAKRKKIIKEVVLGVKKKLKRRSRVKSSELRRMVLSMLNKRSKAAVKAWARYDKKKK